MDLPVGGRDLLAGDGLFPNDLPVDELLRPRGRGGLALVTGVILAVRLSLKKNNKTINTII